MKHYKITDSQGNVLAEFDLPEGENGFQWSRNGAVGGSADSDPPVTTNGEGGGVDDGIGTDPGGSGGPDPTKPK